MTRISTYGQNHQLIEMMLSRGRAVAEGNRQLSTGKQAADFEDLSSVTTSLLSAKSIESRFEAWVGTSQEIGLRLEVYNSSLGSLTDIADQLRQEVVKATANNSGLAFMNIVRGLFERAGGLLNTEVDDRYIFGGTRTDTAPVAATTETALLALAATSDAFVNNTTKLTSEVDDNRTMQYGLLASDVATDLFESFRRIMQFDAGTLPSGAGAYTPAGAFSEPLTDNQRRFLQSEMAGIKQAIDTMRDAEAQNGVRMAQLDKITMRQTDDLVFWRSFISNIEDVNLTEVIANLNEDRTALEASIQVVARLSQISLLNFI